MASTLAGSLFLALLIALPATAVPPADEPPASEKEKGWFQRRKEAKTESGPSATVEVR